MCHRHVVFSIAVVVALLVIVQDCAQAASWYVGPQGKPDNAGTRPSPWDIESTLLGQRGVKPGDTVYLLAGTYRRRPDEKFAVRLPGEKDRPIHVRPAAGERVTIDGGITVENPSNYLWIWDLEILVSEPDTTKQKPTSPGSHPADFTRPWGGLHVYGGPPHLLIRVQKESVRQLRGMPHVGRTGIRIQRENDSFPKSGFWARRSSFRVC